MNGELHELSFDEEADKEVEQEAPVLFLSTGDGESKVSRKVIAAGSVLIALSLLASIASRGAVKRSLEHQASKILDVSKGLPKVDVEELRKSWRDSRKFELISADTDSILNTYLPVKPKREKHKFVNSVNENLFLSHDVQLLHTSLKSIRSDLALEKNAEFNKAKMGRAVRFYSAVHDIRKLLRQRAELCVLITNHLLAVEVPAEHEIAKKKTLQVFEGIKKTLADMHNTMQNTGENLLKERKQLKAGRITTAETVVEREISALIRHYKKDSETLTKAIHNAMVLKEKAWGRPSVLSKSVEKYIKSCMAVSDAVMSSLGRWVREEVSLAGEASKAFRKDVHVQNIVSELLVLWDKHKSTNGEEARAVKATIESWINVMPKPISMRTRKIFASG